jgi:putative ABC transport system permease protein
VSAGTDAFESFALWNDDSEVIGTDGPNVSVRRISPDFLRTLRFAPVAGRAFTRDDYRGGAAGVVIATERFLRSHPASGVGRQVRLGSGTFTVVGVLSDREWYPSTGTDLWMPLPMGADSRPLAEAVWVAARLRTAEGAIQARSQLSVITTRLEHGPRAASARKLSLVTLEQDAKTRAGFGLVGLLGPSMVVLLIACGNVALLLLARGSRREAEMAVRAALGASWWRLVRERLAESVWPAAAGGMLGVALAFAIVGALRAWIGSIPESREAAWAIRIDGRALLFALATTAAIPFVAGLVPAFVAARPNLRSALHSSVGRRKPRRGPYGGRDVFVAVEVALAVVLVVWAGMFARFLTGMWRVQWGFDASRVVSVSLALRHGAESPGIDAQLVEEVLAAARRLPGVERVAAGGALGFDPQWRGERVEFEGCEAATGLGAVVVPVDGEFLATMGVTVERGRGLGPDDTFGAPLVAVISQRHADRCWPGRDPIGRRLRGGRITDGEWFTVVGVVRDAMKTKSVDMVAPVYVPTTQSTRVPNTVYVRAKGDAAALVAPLRSVIRSVDQSQPLDEVGRMDERLLSTLEGAPVIVGIVGGFGLFALVLATLGVFSVISRMVAERTREFGIRMALGATSWAIVRMVAGQAGAVIAVGASVSTVGVIAVTRVAAPDLSALATDDPTLWVGVASLLALVALSASIVPARRATSVPASVALRAE